MARKQYITERICSWCDQPFLDKPGRRFCPECRKIPLWIRHQHEKDPARQAAYVARCQATWQKLKQDPEKYARYTAQHRDYLLQPHIAGPRKVLLHKRYHDDPEKYRATVRKAAAKLRQEVLSAYGGPEGPQCDCCGVTDNEFLCIDHINGDGAAHRKEVGEGSGMYRWLRKNKYPPGFRVLCHNCNISRGIYGHCPHERARETAFADA